MFCLPTRLFLMIRLTTLFLIIFYHLSLSAAIDAGIGTGGGMSGRAVPALSLNYSGNDFDLTTFLSGVRNNLYYQSDYYLGYTFKIWQGEFMWGPINAGFGGAVYYSERGLRSAVSGGVDEKSTDFAVGPSLRIVWKIFGPVFISLDALYGVRDLAPHLFLTFQDVEVLSLGISL